MAWKLAAGALAALVVAGGMAVAAGEKRPAEVKPDQLAQALRGFRGFLAGDVVDRGETGATLFVRSVTIVEGSRAKNPAILLGREAHVLYATERDKKGNERPMKSLVSLMQQLEKMPALAIGAPGGGNVMIMMGDGGGAAAAAGGGIRMQGMMVKGAKMRLNINGAEIRIDGDEDADEAAPAHGGADADAAAAAKKPKGPAATLRVKATGDGRLVADRALPGMQPAATWGGMPKMKFHQAGALKALPKPAAPDNKPRRDAQF